MRHPQSVRIVRLTNIVKGISLVLVGTGAVVG
jgi:hypothetical protein